MTNRVLVTLRQFNADASTSVERETPVLDERWRARRYDIVEELASIALGQAHKGSDALRREFMQCDRDSVTAVVADGERPGLADVSDVEYAAGLEAVAGPGGVGSSKVVRISLVPIIIDLISLPFIRFNIKRELNTFSI